MKKPLCELCGTLRALRKRNPLEKERYVGAKLAKDRKARKADLNLHAETRKPAVRKGKNINVRNSWIRRR